MIQHSHHTAPTQFVDAAGIRFAYRRFGTSRGVPLVFNMHFTGTMDHWDPLVTDGFASALGNCGIRVNAVAPGVVETEMSNFARTDAGRDFTLGIQALKRIAQPDDIGAAVVFLASDEARWITGDTLRVDGGSKL
jgi:hypothetical protein